MDIEFESRPGKFWPFALKAAVLAAVFATVLSSAWVATLGAIAARANHRFEFESMPTLWDVGKGTVLFSVVTAGWYGPFAFLAGFAGAAVLYLRRRKIRTLKRLVVESMAIGFVLVLLFPLYDAAVYSQQLSAIGYQFSLLQSTGIFVVPIAVSAVCALACRRQFLHRPKPL